MLHEHEEMNPTQAWTQVKHESVLWREHESETSMNPAFRWTWTRTQLYIEPKGQSKLPNELVVEHKSAR